MITGKELIEKMYSENYDEYEDTRLYSTGDDELDDLLEKAFCEGYEYAQREFGNKENKVAKKALENSIVEKHLDKIGMEKDHPMRKPSKMAYKSIIRSKNWVDTVGGKIGNYQGSEVKDPEFTSVPKELSLDQKINLKQFFDKGGNLGHGKERAKNVKNIIKNQPVITKHARFGTHVNQTIWKGLR